MAGICLGSMVVELVGVGAGGGGTGTGAEASHPDLSAPLCAAACPLTLSAALPASPPWGGLRRGTRFAKPLRCAALGRGLEGEGGGVVSFQVGMGVWLRLS